MDRPPEVMARKELHMTHQRLCGPQKQPCPSPYLCGTDCNYETAGLETPRDKAVRRFWDASQPGYYELIDAPANAWDDFTAWFNSLPLWKQLFAAFFTMAALGMAVGVVVGYVK